jgi:FtsH-binding integral membrane protein
MGRCDNFIGYTYLHLLAAGLISAVSAKMDLVRKAGFNTDKILTEIFLAVVALVLVVVIVTLPVGIPKYILFAVFVIIIGATLRSVANRYKAEGTLNDVLFTVSGIFMAMTAVGFYDQQNLLGYGTYLFAALIGLILGRAGVGLAMVVGAPEEKITGWNLIFSVLATFIFSFYLAYDTQVLKEMARECKARPDYINGALSLYLDIVNLFYNVGDLTEA